MILQLMLAVAAVPAGASAMRPSFDCTHAATRVETMICADPALAARDRAMQVAYRHARRLRRSWQPSPQREWLAQRNACSSADCIAAAYDERFGEMMGEDALLPAPFERSGQPGDLAMVDLGGGWFLFEISALYVYPRHDNVNFGGAAGIVQIAAGQGRWRGRRQDQETACVLDFTRRPTGWAVRQVSDCPNGLNVELGGFYRLRGSARQGHR
jgi:uncharacterized protein YecT (DUF1311 family)